jgi:hypothetical protein
MTFASAIFNILIGKYLLEKNDVKLTQHTIAICDAHRSDTYIQHEVDYFYRIKTTENLENIDEQYKN